MMVDIISGSGNGLYGNSVVKAGASFGPDGTQLSINAATGNLVLQRQDSMDFGGALPFELLRTYNSQGNYDDDNGDQFRFGVNKRLDIPRNNMSNPVDWWWRPGRVEPLNSPQGFPPPTIFPPPIIFPPPAPAPADYDDISFRDSDGSITRFQWNLGENAYLRHQGEGAIDRLHYDFLERLWVLTDGDSGQKTFFELQGSQARVVRETDVTGYSQHYIYNKEGFVNRIYDSIGRQIRIHYRDGQADRVTRLVEGEERTELEYRYDNQNRLKQVVTALSSDDNGRMRYFVTDYQYDGDSHRIAKIQKTQAYQTETGSMKFDQSSGEHIAFDWILVDSSYRVRTVEQGLGDAKTRILFVYEDNGKATRVIQVTNPETETGPETRYEFDAAGRIKTVTLPTLPGEEETKLNYFYDQQGNLTRSIDGLGRETEFTYDSEGLISKIVQDQKTIERDYTADNQLKEERIIDTRDPNNPLTYTTRYVHDSQLRLRFVIDAMGNVKETRYKAINSNIEVESHWQYDKALSQVELASLSGMGNTKVEQFLADWTQSDKAKAARQSDFTIDRFARRTTHEVFGEEGVIKADVYQYDHRGQLLSSLEETVDHNAERQLAKTVYAYDNLGRLEHHIDALNQVSTTFYDDAQRKITTRFANGLIETHVHDSRGQEVSLLQQQAIADSDERIILLDKTFQYDEQGRLASVAHSASGDIATQYLYDQKDRLIALVDGEGRYQELRYDDANRLTATIDYENFVAVTDSKITLADKPTTSLNDRVNQFFYDANDNLSFQVGGNGEISEFQFDTLGNLTKEIRFDALFPGGGRLLKTESDIKQFLAQQYVTKQAKEEGTRVKRYGYDALGNLVSVIHEDGAVTSNFYNSHNEKIKSVSYFNRLPIAREDFELSTVQVLEKYELVDSNQDIRKDWLYDKRGNLIAEVDGEGYLKTQRFDIAGNLVAKTQYIDADYRLNDSLRNHQDLALWVANAGSQKTESISAYNVLHQEVLHINENGLRTEYSWTENGRIMNKRVFQNKQLLRQQESHYDALGRVVLQNVEAQDTIDYGQENTYNERSQLIKSVDSEGAETWYFYHADDSLSFQIDWKNETEGKVTGYLFNAFSEVRLEKQYKAAISKHELASQDLDNVQYEKIFSRLQQWALEQSAAHQQFQYDSSGFLTEHLRADGSFIKHAYNAFNEEITRTNSIDAMLGRTKSTDFAYDKSGQLISQSGPHHSKQWAYDAFGRPLSLLEGDGEVQRSSLTEYDNNGRVLREVIDPSGISRFTHYHYNGAGEITRIDQGGKSQVWNPQTQQFELSKEVETLKSQVFIYDDAGQLIIDGLIDPTISNYTEQDILNKTVYRYNEVGQVVEQIDANGQHRIYQYDGLGRVHFEMEVVTPRGAENFKRKVAVKQFHYNQAGQLIQQTTFEKAMVLEPGSLTVEEAALPEMKRVQLFFYDSDGNLAIAIDEDNYVKAYHYDLQGNLRSTYRYAEAQPELSDWYQELIEVGTELPTLGEAFAWLADSSLHSQNRINHQLSDDRGRVVIEIDGDGYLKQHRWNDQNQLVETVRYSQAVTVQAVLNKLALAVTEVDAAQFVSSLSTFDDPNKIKRNFLYDDAGQLRLATDGEGYSDYYEYDALGQLLLQRRIGLALSEASKTAITNHEITSAHLEQLNFVLEESNDNRLITWEQLSKHHVRDELYRYDSNGRLVAKTGSSGDARITTWDGLDRETWVQDGIEVTRVDNGAPLEEQFKTVLRDPSGQVLYLITEAHGVVSIDRDASGELVSVTQTQSEVSWGDTANVIISTYQSYLDGSQTWENIQWIFASMDAFLAGLEDTQKETLAKSNSEHQQRVEFLAGESRGDYYDYTNARWESYAYDHYDNVTRRQWQKSETHTAAVHWNYDTNGRLLSSYDAMGQETRYFYDADGRQTYIAKAVTVEVTDASGKHKETRFEVSSSEYNETGDRVVAEKRWKLRVDLSAQDHNGNDSHLRSMLQTMGEAAVITEKSFKYDKRGHVTAITDGNGDTEYQRWNAYSQLGSKWIDSNLHIGNPDSQVKRNSELFFYDVRGQMVRSEVRERTLANLVEGHTVEVGESSQLIKLSQRSYDAFGNLIALADGAGITTEFEYDRNGLRISSRNADGESSHQQYTGFGELSESRDTQNRGARYVYDHDKRQVTKWLIDEDGKTLASVETTYNAFGDVVLVKNELGLVNEYHYDKAGNLIQKVEATNLERSGGLRKTVFEYNDNNLLTKTTLDGRERVIFYDAQNRQIEERVSFNDSSINTSAERRTDGLAQRILYQYDGAGRVTTTTKADGTVVDQYYDDAGNTTWIVSQTGQQVNFTHFQYNSLGLVIQSEQGQLSQYVKVEPTEAQKQTLSSTLFHYDAAGQRIAEIELDLSTSEQHDTISEWHYLFDTSGRVSQKTNKLGESEYYFYDEMGRREWLVQADGSVFRSFYDVSGNITKTVQFNQPIANTLDWSELAQWQGAYTTEKTQDRVTRFSWNVRGLLEAQQDSDGRVTAHQYNASGQKTHTWQLAETLPMDADLSALNLTLSNPEGNRLEQFYYDGLGRLSYHIDQNGEIKSYFYNQHDQLTERRHYQGFLPRNKDLSLVELKNALAMTASGEPRVENYFYNGLGQREYVIDAAGQATQFHYTNDGKEAGSTHYETRFPANLISRNTALAELAELLENSDWRSNLIITDTQGRERFQLTLYQSENSTKADVIETRYSLTERQVGGYSYFLQAVDSRAYADSFEISSWDSVEALGDRISALINLGDPMLLSRQVNWRDGAGRQVEQARFTDASTELSDNTPRFTETYNERGLVAERTDSNGHSEFYFYNQAGQREAEFKTVEIQDGKRIGYWTSKTYNQFGEVSTETRWLARVEFDGTSSLPPTEGQRQITHYAYDAGGRKTARIVRDENLQLLSVEHYRYDKWGNKTERRVLKDDLSRELYHSLAEHDQATGVSLHEKILVTVEAWQDDDSRVLIDRYTYNSRQKIKSLTLASDETNQVHYHYNAWGDLTITQHRNGQFEEVLYDENGQQRGVQKGFWPVGTAASEKVIHQETRTQRNGWGEISTLEKRGSETKSTERFVYNHRGQIEYAIDGLGTVTRNHYNEIGLLVATVTYPKRLAEWLDASSDASLRQHVESFIEQQSIAEPQPQVRVYYHDSLGNQTKSYAVMETLTQSQLEDPASIDSSQLLLLDERHYNALGQVTVAIDRNGKETHYLYDGMGRVSQEKQRDNKLGEEPATFRIINYTYNAFGQITEKRWGDGELIQSQQFDSLGRLTQQIDARGVTQEWAYDLHGNVIAESLVEAGDSDEIGQRLTQHYFYDSRGHRFAHLSAGGALTIARYDSAGNQVLTYQLATPVDPIDEKTLEQLTEIFNRVGVLDPGFIPSISDKSESLKAAKETVVDSQQELLAELSALTAIDPDADRTEWFFFDALNRQVAHQQVSARYYSESEGLTEQAGTAFTDYRELEDGIVKISTDANGLETRQYFDANQRLVYEVMGDSSDANSSTTQAGETVTSYLYDGLGNLVRTTQHFLSAELAAESLSQVVDEHINDRSTHFAFDQLNRLRSQEVDKAVFGGLEEKIVKQKVRTEYDYVSPVSTWVSQEQLYELRRGKGDEAFVFVGEVSVKNQQYDQLGRVVYQEDFERRGTDSAAQISSAMLRQHLEYDRSDNLVGKTILNDSEQLKTHRNTYVDGQLRETLGFAGHKSFAYDGYGRLVKETDHVAGRITEYAYDADNNQVLIAYYDQEENVLYAKRQQHNVFGQLQTVYQVVFENGDWGRAEQGHLLQRNVCDQLGRIEQKQIAGKTQWLAYNRAGQVTLDFTSMDAEHQSRTWQDWLSVVSSKNNASASNQDSNSAKLQVAVSTYNEAGDLLTHNTLSGKGTLVEMLTVAADDGQDENSIQHAKQRLAYNRFSEVSHYWDAALAETTYLYNHMGQRVETINVKDTRWHSAYNGATGDIDLASTFANSYQYYDHDAQGRVIKHLDENGHLSTQEWDFDNAVVSRDYLGDFQKDVMDYMIYRGGDNNGQLTANLLSEVARSSVLSEYNAFGDLLTQIRQTRTDSSTAPVKIWQELRHEYAYLASDPHQESKNTNALAAGEDPWLPLGLYVRKLSYSLAHENDSNTEGVVERYGIRANVSNSAGQVLNSTRYKNVLRSEDNRTMDSADRELAVQSYRYDSFGDVAEVGQWQDNSARRGGLEHALYWESRERDYLAGSGDANTVATIAYEDSMTRYYRDVSASEMHYTQREVQGFNAWQQKLTHVYDINAQDIDLMSAGNDPFSELEQAPDPSYSHRYAYDGHGNLLAVYDADGQRLTEHQYDEKGQLTATIHYVDGSRIGGNQEYYEYNNRGQRTVEVSVSSFGSEPQVRYKQASWNASGHLEKVSIFAGSIDEAGNYAKASDDYLWQVSYGYDGQGNLIRQVLDQPGLPTEENVFVFDEHNRVVRNRQEGVLQKIVYDGLDRQIAIENGSDDHTVLYQYRADGRIAEATIKQAYSPSTSDSGGSEAEPNENAKSWRRQTYYYIYDDEWTRFDGEIKGRLAGVELGLPADILDIELTESRFSNQGNLIGMIEAIGVDNSFDQIANLDFYAYDSMGRKQEERRWQLLDDNKIESKNYYDAFNNLSKTVQNVYSRDESVKVYSEITTDYRYRDPSKGNKDAIAIGAQLRYLDDIEDEQTKNYIDSIVNPLWSTALSNFHYEQIGQLEVLQSVEKFRLDHGIDNESLQKIIYETELTEEEQELPEEERTQLLYERISEQIAAKYDQQKIDQGRIDYRHSVQGQISQRDDALTKSDESTNQYFYFAGKNLGQQVIAAGQASKVLLASPQAGAMSSAQVSNHSNGSYYRVRAGDSLQVVASLYYGDPSLWYVIADANAISSSSLIPGQNLFIPKVTQSSHNNVNTFQPYDAGSRLGNVNPVLPDSPEIPDAPAPPPPPSECEQALTILVTVAIAIAFAVLTAVATAFLGPVGAMFAGFLLGATEGAVTSLATQGLEMAFGRREQGDINWANVASSAAGGAVAGAFMGGFASVGKLTKLAKTAGKQATLAQRMARGLTSTLGRLGKNQQHLGNIALGGVMGASMSAASQGVSLALGQQQKWDWVNFGKTAITSGLSVGVSGMRGEGGYIGEGTKLNGKVLGSASSRFAKNAGIHAGISFSASIVEHAAYGRNFKDFDWGYVAMQAVGDGFTEAASDRVTQRINDAAELIPARGMGNSTFLNNLNMLARQATGLTSQKQNRAIIDKHVDSIQRAFTDNKPERSELLANLTVNFKSLKPLNLTRSLEALPNKIRQGDQRAWQESLTSTNSLKVTAGAINRARTIDELDGALTPNCFAAGTLIHTETGLVPIEKINKTHRILTRNENDPDAPLVYRPILEHFVNVNKEVVTVVFRDGLNHEEAITSTPGHPYFVKEKGEWVDAENLEIGDILSSSKHGKITVVSAERRSEKMNVYNFEVPVDHTYFVGFFGLWTHNTGCTITEANSLLKKNIDSLVHEGASEWLTNRYAEALQQDPEKFSSLKSKLEGKIREKVKKENIKQKGEKDSAWKTRVGNLARDIINRNLDDQVVKTLVERELDSVKEKRFSLIGRFLAQFEQKALLRNKAAISIHIDNIARTGKAPPIIPEIMNSNMMLYRGTTMDTKGKVFKGSAGSSATGTPTTVSPVMAMLFAAKGAKAAKSARGIKVDPVIIFQRSTAFEPKEMYALDTMAAAEEEVTLKMTPKEAANKMTPISLDELNQLLKVFGADLDWKRVDEANFQQYQDTARRLTEEQRLIVGDLIENPGARDRWKDTVMEIESLADKNSIAKNIPKNRGKELNVSNPDNYRSLLRQVNSFEEMLGLLDDLKDDNKKLTGKK